MKKLLLFIFFLLFISVLFIWDQELTWFWTNRENHSFLVQEFLLWSDQYRFILDYLVAYKYPISLIGFLYFWYVFYKRWKRKKKENEKKNIFHGGKVIYDANAILSPDSLPEADKKREKKLKNAPALINTSEEKSEITPPEPNDDLDPETMRKILDAK
jgi:hypothetical protein